ncbi:MAG: exodeoxyribonuclease VII large subunit, partial [Sphingomicrobium sp.]
SRHAERGRERLELSAARWPAPAMLFAPQAQRVDEVGERLPRALAARAGTARAELNAVAPRLRRELLSERVARGTERLAALWKMAELVHPDRPLARGFVRVTGKAGRLVTTTADAIAGQLLTLNFADGKVAARVERSRPRSYVRPQPGLFDAAPEE